MAHMKNKNSNSLPAGADLSSDQFKFVKLSSGQVVLQDTAGASCLGVLVTPAAAAGRAVEVAVGEGQVVKVITGAIVAAGAKVQSDGDGLAITAASGDHVQGKAISGGASGEVIEVLLQSEHILA